MLAGIAQFCFYNQFTIFAPYDDEGFLMISIKKFLDGLPLYEQVYTQYGPFYYTVFWLVHAVFDAPLTHNATRAINIAFWMFGSACAAAIAYRLTRSSFFAALAMLEAAHHLLFLKFSPGHPQALSVVLIASSATLFAFTVGTRATIPSLIMVGILAGGLAFTKINVGAYLIFAYLISLALYLREARAYRWFGFILCGFLIAMPSILMRDYGLPGQWAFSWIVSATLGIAGLIVVGYGVREPGRVPFQWLGAGLTGIVLSVFASLVVPLAKGTDLSALIDGILLRPAEFYLEFVIEGDFPATGILFAILALGMAFGYRVLAHRPGFPRSLVDHGLAWAKLAIGALFILSGGFSMEAVIGCWTPFIWLLMIPPPNTQSAGSYDTLVRMFLAWAITLLPLQAYPVASDQMIVGSYLFAPAAAILIWDWTRTVPIHWPIVERISRGPSTLRWSPVVALFVVMAAYAAGTDFFRMASWYRGSVSTGLHGAEWIRLRPGQPEIVHFEYGEPDENPVATLNWLVSNLKSHSDTFVSLPGMNSLYFWTGIDPPTGFNAGHWMDLLNDREQEAIIEKLQESDRAAAVFNGKWLGFWARGENVSDRPLVRYIMAEFRSLYRVGEYHFMVPKTRDVRTVYNSLMSDEKSFEAGGPVRALPRGILAGRESMTLSLWFNTRRPGIMVGAAGETTDGIQTVPVAYTDADGLLRCEFYTGKPEPISSAAPVTDGLWHHLAIVGDPTGQIAYLDGQSIGGIEGAWSFDNHPLAVLGTGAGPGWPGLEAVSLPFEGSIAEVAVYYRAVEPEEIAALYERSARR